LFSDHGTTSCSKFLILIVALHPSIDQVAIASTAKPAGEDGRPPKLTSHQGKEVLWRSGRQGNHDHQGKKTPLTC
jgi:hypothetical protein